MNIDEHKNILEDISQRILSADDMNEDALRLHIKLLIDQEKENIARYTFNEFVTNYKHYYNEEFPLTFERFIKEEGLS